MKYTLLGILIATMIVAAVLGPALILLWLSWRSVVVGVLTLCAVFLFFASVLAAGGAMYNPASGHPIVVVIVGWIAAAACLLAAYALAKHGLNVKALHVVAGFLVLGWTGATYHLLPVAWFVVAHPEELTKMLNEKPRAKSRLTLRDGVGRDIRISRGSDAFIFYVAPGTDSSDRVLALLGDSALAPFIKEHRATSVVAERKGNADPLVRFAYTPSRRHPPTIEQVPSFYDPKTNAFRLDAYQWMTGNIGVPVDEAQAIYLRYFDTLPVVAP